MANRETYPSQLFPLRGDTSAEAGDTSVTVTGLQKIPVSATAPTNNQVLTYVAADNAWEPQNPSAGVTFLVEVNGVGVSTDYVNFVDADLTVNSGTVLGFKVNGVAV
jgi:hypothetical protein